MAKISEETKNDIAYYVEKKGIDQRLSDYCLSRSDVDVVKICVGIATLSRLQYLKAKQDAPHNIEANVKARGKLWDECRTRDEEDLRNLEAYLREVYPIRSDTKIAKSDALDTCKEILKDHGFGKKRIEGIVPILTYILNDEEEEFEELNHLNIDHLL